MGGPAPPELVDIVEEWRIGPERGQGFEQQCRVALLPEHRRRKGFDRAVLVQEPRRRDRADPRNARIAVGRVAHEREEVGDQLGLHAKFLAHPCRIARSEEHTSELQSLTNLVCRLLLEKKKKKTNNT